MTNIEENLFAIIAAKPEEKNGKAHSSQYSDLQLVFHVNNQ